jgi:type VI secretion system secreted protein VgrG
MTNQNQNPGQQNQKPGQKPGQQQGAGQKPRTTAAGSEPSGPESQSAGQGRPLVRPFGLSESRQSPAARRGFSFVGTSQVVRRSGHRGH